jgi:ribonuclease Z
VGILRALEQWKVSPDKFNSEKGPCLISLFNLFWSGLSKDADIVIHEATNSYLAGIDKDTDLRSVTRDAVVHGHSTPYIAGEFAKRVGAKRLLLNHFSARYKGDQSVDSISIMTRLEGQAMKAAGLKSTEVAAAWDFMILPIPQN